MKHQIKKLDAEGSDKLYTHISLSYKNMRKWIAIIGLMLPFLLLVN